MTSQVKRITVYGGNLMVLTLSFALAFLCSLSCAAAQLDFAADNSQAHRVTQGGWRSPFKDVEKLDKAGIEDYVESTSDDGYLGDSLPLLNAIPPNFLRIDWDAQKGAPSDYFEEVLSAGKGKILRFRAMPIPVYINGFPDNNFIACVVRSFETWEDRTNGAVRFVQVDEPDKARIQVAWKRLGKGEDNSGCMLGAHTITSYSPKHKGNGVMPDFGPKYEAAPQIIEVNLDLVMSKSANIRYRLLQNIVVHELGHTLGMLGHSKNVYDMMYSVTDEHSRLSQNDINTLIKLYRQKVDVPL